MVRRRARIHGCRSRSKRARSQPVALGALAVLAIATVAVLSLGELVPSQLRARGIGSRTVREVLGELGPGVEAELGARSAELGVSWPPARTTWIALKEERRLEAWVAGDRGPFRLLARYPILAASGTRGPKRREGDRQVPEGFYRLTRLNPNSQFHLSVRVDYPNREDIQHRRVERASMGGDIFVHGSHYSVGCIAVGDDAIEELFVLAARVPPGARRILIAPVDFRIRPDEASDPDAWIGDLYRRLRAALEEFRPPIPDPLASGRQAP